MMARVTRELRFIFVVGSKIPAERAISFRLIGGMTAIV
jgi:hypothetical protein